MIFELAVILFTTMAVTLVNSLDCPNKCTCSVANGLNLTVCQESGFQSIPSDLSPHTNFLDLSANNLGRLPNYTFSAMKLTDLQSIVLRRAGISELARYAFANLRRLKELDLSENRLHTLDQFTFADNKMLEMVNFSGNPLVKLTAFQFAPLPRLTSLDLHSCALSSVEPEAFSNLFFLETLNLANNSLATLPGDIFTWLPHLQSVELSANRWRCDCDVQILTVSLQYRGLYSKNQTCVYESNAEPVLWHRMNNVSKTCVPLIEEHLREMLLSGTPRLRPPIVFHYGNTSVRFSSSHFHLAPASNPYAPRIVAVVSAILVTVFACCLFRRWVSRRRRSRSMFRDGDTYEEEMAGLRGRVYRDYLDEAEAGPSTSGGYRNENFCLLGDSSTVGDGDDDSDLSVSIGL